MGCSIIGNDGSAASTVTRTFHYDSLGRLETAETVIDEGSGHLTQVYEERTTYDQYGRIFQEFDASDDQYGIQLLYGEYGHLQAIREARDGAPEPGWHGSTGRLKRWMRAAM